MKTLTTFFWIANVLLAIYLGVTLVASKPMQKHHYQSINTDVELINSLQEISKSIDKQVFRIMKRTVEKEGNRPMDLVYLKKASQILDLEDSIYRKLMSFRQPNALTTSTPLGLLKAHTQSLVSIDTAIAKNINTTFSKLFWNKINPNEYLRKLQIASYQMIILWDKHAALKVLSKKIGDNYDGFPIWHGLMLPKNNLVEVGQEYEAKMFLAFKNLRGLWAVNILLNGEVLPIEEYYNGKFSFSLLDTNPIFDQNGECRKTWKAAITIARPFRDTTYIIEKEYIIRKKL